MDDVKPEVKPVVTTKPVVSAIPSNVSKTPAFWNVKKVGKNVESYDTKTGFVFKGTIQEFNKIFKP